MLLIRGGQTQLGEPFVSLKLPLVPRSRQLSFVTYKGEYAILVLRNYKMQAENLYSYLIANCQNLNLFEIFETF